VGSVRSDLRSGVADDDFVLHVQGWCEWNLQNLRL
jgi:hypothetical protein